MISEMVRVGGSRVEAKTAGQLSARPTTSLEEAKINRTLIITVGILNKMSKEM